MRPAVGDLGERGVAVARGARGKSLVVKDARDQLPHVGLVIDDQNVTCLGPRPARQSPVAASILASLLVVSAPPLVSCSGGFVSLVGAVEVAATCWPSMVDLLWPVTEKRRRIQAPRWPGRKSEASFSSILPPWSSNTRPTMARPRPVPLARVVT